MAKPVRWVSSAVLLSVGLTFCSAGAALAQEVTAPDAGGGAGIDSGGLAGAIARALFEGIDQWLADHGPSAFLKLFGLLFGTFVRWLVETSGGTIGAGSGAGNLFVQLPLDLVTREPWVAGASDTLRTAGLLALGGAVAVGVICAAIGTLFGFTYGELQRVAPWAIAAGLGMAQSRSIIERLVSGANAISASFVDPALGLPGWREMNALDFNTGYGLVVLLYAVLGIVMMVSRIVTLGLVVACVATAPLAILCGLIPGLGHFFGFWLRLLLSSIVVQIPQALVIGYGGSLVARYGAGAGIFSLLVGLGMLWLAVRLPRMMPGLHSHGPSWRSSLSLARDVAVIATAGNAAVAGRAALSYGGSAINQSPQVIYGSGPVYYRPGPILPAPLDALPPPRRWTSMGSGVAIREAA